jgi:hypothetical protein
MLEAAWADALAEDPEAVWRDMVRPDGRNQNGGLNRFPYPAGRGTTQHENGGTEKHFLTG